MDSPEAQEFRLQHTLDYRLYIVNSHSWNFCGLKRFLFAINPTEIKHCAWHPHWWTNGFTSRSHSEAITRNELVGRALRDCDMKQPLWSGLPLTNSTVFSGKITLQGTSPYPTKREKALGSWENHRLKMAICWGDTLVLWRVVLLPSAEMLRQRCILIIYTCDYNVDLIDGVGWCV